MTVPGTTAAARSSTVDAGLRAGGRWWRRSVRDGRANRRYVGSTTVFSTVHSSIE